MASFDEIEWVCGIFDVEYNAPYSDETEKENY